MSLGNDSTIFSVCKDQPSAELEAGFRWKTNSEFDFILRKYWAESEIKHDPSLLKFEHCTVSGLFGPQGVDAVKLASSEIFGAGVTELAKVMSQSSDKTSESVLRDSNLKSD
jgi:hypothetical protein